MVQRQWGNDKYNQYYDWGNGRDGEDDSDKISTIFRGDDSAKHGPAEALKAATAKRTVTDGGNGRCGVTIPMLRIFNGNEAQRGQFPWQANIIKEKYGLRQQKCGGVLIHPRFVLTAAHCLDPNECEGYRIEVHLGVISWNVVDKDSLTFAPDRIILHPNFRVGQDNVTCVRNENDIALMRLPQAAPYTDYIRPICAPNTQINIPPSTLVVAGWGITEKGYLSEQLNFAHVTAVDRSTCAARVGHAIPGSQLCAGGHDTDPCYGDSGGPLIQANADARGEMVLEVVGLVSFGPDNCRRLGEPRTYTRVATFREWIEEIIQQQQD